MRAEAPAALFLGEGGGRRPREVAGWGSSWLYLNPFGWNTAARHSSAADLASIDNLASTMRVPACTITLISVSPHPRTYLVGTCLVVPTYPTSLPRYTSEIRTCAVTTSHLRHAPSRPTLPFQSTVLLHLVGDGTGQLVLPAWPPYLPGRATSVHIAHAAFIWWLSQAGTLFLLSAWFVLACPQPVLPASSPLCDGVHDAFPSPWRHPMQATRAPTHISRRLGDPREGTTPSVRYCRWRW